MDIIEKEVLRSLQLTGSGLYSAVFNVCWEVPNFIMNEPDESTDIGQALTVTGASSHAYAGRHADYLK
jgi:hypothetical protein